MQKKIKQLMKRSLVGLVALAMAVSSISVMGLPVQAAEAEPVSVTNFTSHIPGEIVLENTGGDNLILLQPLSSEDEFVFGADVTFTNLDEQQSAALIFGIRDNNPNDSLKANIHKKIDWNVPARVWGYGTDELKCPGENGQANTFFESNNIDVTQKFRMEVSVQKNDENKYVLTYSLTNTAGEKVTAAQGILNDSYTGGRFGLMTYSSRAVFSNITVDGQKYGALENTEDGLTIHGVNGDAHTVSDVCLEAEKGFTYETDIDLAADTCSAALTFGIRNKDNPGEAWIGANFNFNDNGGAGGARVFKVGNGATDIASASLEGKLDRSKTIHAKLHVSSEGHVTYELYNTNNTENKVTVTGTLSDYQGGYLGLLTFDSSAVFTNTTYTLDEVTPDEEPPAAVNYNTNLGELTYAGGNGTWKMTENGLYSDATGMGDCFAFSAVQGANFVYSTDIDFDGTEGAAALVFRSNQNLDNKECYAVNIDVGSHRCKFWRWQKNDALQLIDEKEVPATADEKYTLKVVAYDSWILYYVNDQLIASTGDYVLQPGNKGQNTVLKEGCFGILNWNSKVTFQNTCYKELSGDFNPLLTDISVTSSVGTVEEKTQFTPTEPITLQYVKNDASTVNIEVAKASNNAVVEVKDAYGTVYADGSNIPVNEGSNYITVTSTVTAEDGMSATATYRVNVHRFKADSVYYNEAYRNQYHYSVKEGWANDPNGLVYFNGTYHMFYQFYDDIKWGPMHWAHATSTDLIHWEEEPIALYPDANGAMYSGCIVVDANNTSGFFDGTNGGLVALITADGNGERIKLAYSADEGKTWTKVDEIAADWTDDPLRVADFRDPKVFRWEGKWFMVVAGGPLRIYSSDDLKTWTCESTYADLHTECPDLYPIQAPDSQIKWVLSRGGRFYKVGDFKTVDGNWRFVPDADYTSSDGVMNFGRDFYAAMTYYVQDFGTAANPNLPELVELNWMNTWDDYCNQVAETVGQDFNGTFNLNLKLGLKKDGDKYVLTQTPISGYESLRDTANKQEWTQVTVEPNSALLKDFVGDTYEIIAKFYPEEGTTKVGFKVRTGEDQETLVVYDLETQRLSIDRSRSGVIISGKFAEVTSQNVTENADGSVDLHIYVDKASVEVFAKGHTAAGSVQIFPSPVSVGAQVLVEGTAAKADITIYPLASIWTNKAEVTTPQYIGSTSATSQNLYVGGTVKLNAYVLPTSVSQEITWSVKEGSEVAEVDASGTVTALQKGTAVIVAASNAKPELTKEFTIRVTENNFNTNIPEFVNVSGNWTIDDETLSVSNGGQNDYYMSAEAVEGDFSLETNIRYTKGLINLFLASEGQNPHVGAGAYTIQFGGDTNVRLFPFGKDDFTTGTMASSINDGAYHCVKVVKEGQTITVYVDDKSCLEHTFEVTEAFFANGHVGIGLWDGALDVQNFFVYPLEDSHICENMKHMEAKDATCVAEGNIEYWICECGKAYADKNCSQEVTDIKLPVNSDAHDYPETPSSYTNDGDTHTEHYVCGNDASHTYDITGVAHDTSNAATSHNCICGAAISLCDDDDKDHLCDVCGEIISLCTDSDNHECDICGGVISVCVDNDKNHLCDICKKEISLCIDDDNDHKCDVCKETISLCADADNDHKCDVCKKDISLCADADNDHKCDVCKKDISLCADADNDHKCDVCKETISLCTDTDNNHICDICKKDISLCIDDNNDHKCDDCGETISLCVDGDNDHKCDICGETISLCVDGDNDHKCDICGEAISLCTDGDNDHKCDTCKETISLCTGGEATCEAAAKCDICGESYGEKDPGNHTGDTEIRDAKEATETETGYTGDTYCLGCGELLEEGQMIPVKVAPSGPSTPIKPAVPNWSGIINKWFDIWWGKAPEKCEHSYTSVVTAPTCTNKGYTTYTCSKCGDCYKDSYTKALGHTWDDGQVTKEATCTKNGAKTYICDTCGNTKTETIKATGHKYENGVCGGCGQKEPAKPSKPNKPGFGFIFDWIFGGWWGDQEKCEHSYTSVVTAPTCTNKGYTTYTCSKCGDCYKDSYTKALGHTWDDGQVTKEATCTKNGAKTYICDTCGNTKTETIKATDHKYENGVCGGCGQKEPAKPSKPNKPGFGFIFDWIFGGWWK